MDDDETAAYLKASVAAEAGLPDSMAHRLRGSSVGELRADAERLRAELGMPALGERQRDSNGKFTGDDMNARIREALGR
jgi:hypothetical protein